MKKFAPILILVAGILWGSMGLFVRTLNAQGLASMDIVGLRAVVTAVSMLLFLLIFDRKLFVIRLKDLRASGARTVAAACPHCLTMLESARALDRDAESVKIADIAELVAAALPEDVPGAAA